MRDRSAFPIATLRSTCPESIRERIERVRWDLSNIEQFYTISYSRNRYTRLQQVIDSELNSLEKLPFESYTQDEKIDFILLKTYLQRRLRDLLHDAKKDEKLLPYVGSYFLIRLASIIEARQRIDPVDGKATAATLVDLIDHVAVAKTRIAKGQETADPPTALRAAKAIAELRSHLQEWYEFYKGYDPLFTWWISDPCTKLEQAIADLEEIIKKTGLGLEPDDDDTIIGQPVGRAVLLDALESEMIPYTPEELIDIGKQEYAWCEAEMQNAASTLGFQYWRSALEHIKNEYVEPGQQPGLVRDLTREATEYVKRYDLVTVPSICEETSRTFMMSPKRQKMNPFFLGGDSIIVSYPTSTMSHEDKLMSMRGNNVHFSRATVFHEMIPGHHLHMHYMKRVRPYRQFFFTPFCTEGWSFYWEMLLWDKESWTKTPENRIGMLFWRMHRCARIVFSLKYHLGEMTSQECVDLLVDWVGHERATAEGEVRRSIMGDYGPLYQAGYMLGGLQLWALRKEVVVNGKMGEKEFHDRFLGGNQMPVELFRALIKEENIGRDFESRWKFYDKS